MKKILFVFIFNLLAGALIVLCPNGLDGVMFTIIPTIFFFFLLPFISGILLILVQSRRHAYEFLPLWLLGSVINNLSLIFIVRFCEWSKSSSGVVSFDLYNLLFLDVFLPFIALSLFGALIGLLIRGATLLSQKK